MKTVNREFIKDVAAEYDMWQELSAIGEKLKRYDEDFPIASFSMGYARAKIDCIENIAPDAVKYYKSLIKSGKLIPAKDRGLKKSGREDTGH